MCLLSSNWHLFSLCSFFYGLSSQFLASTVIDDVQEIMVFILYLMPFIFNLLHMAVTYAL